MKKQMFIYIKKIKEENIQNITIGCSFSISTDLKGKRLFNTFIIPSIRRKAYSIYDLCRWFPLRIETSREKVWSVMNSRQTWTYFMLLFLKYQSEGDNLLAMSLPWRDLWIVYGSQLAYERRQRHLETVPGHLHTLSLTLLLSVHLTHMLW